MWTPPRVLLLVVGFIACATSFAIYYRYLGWIDGLPALPAKYLATAARLVRDDLQQVDEPLWQKLLKQAFDDSCQELGYPIKLTIQGQEILLASDQVIIEADGRLKLSPFSAAVLKKRTDGGFPEIHTVHCDVAYVTFDRKIETLSDMARGKLVAAEFIGDKNILSGDPRKGAIRVVHNHGTPQPDDDIVITMPGPLYFRDRSPGQAADEPQLWTRSYVDITDYQSRPPHIVKAQGMNIFLTEAVAPLPDRTAKNSKRPGQVVKRIELINVDMNLTLEDQTSFPAGDRSAGPARYLTLEDKPKLLIRTLGPFQYDLEKDLATFDVAPAAADSVPQCVEVVRASRAAGNDVLQCDHLEVQFHKKSASKVAPAANDVGGALEIGEARATGKLVVLTSDAEKLHARGTVMTFNQAKRTNILRGE